MINNFDLVTRPDNNPSSLGKYITDHSDNGFEGFVKTVGADLRTGSYDCDMATGPQQLAERRFLFNLLDHWWVLGNTYTDESVEDLRRLVEKLYIEVQQRIPNRRYYESRRPVVREIEQKDLPLPLIIADWMIERLIIANGDFM
jgi:hypothetical protein